MKVHTNIKAGGIGTSGTRTNHNETLIRNKEEEKKRLRKKLRLNKETVRELKDSDLKMAAGGATSGTCTQFFTRCFPC